MWLLSISREAAGSKPLEIISDDKLGRYQWSLDLRIRRAPAAKKRRPSPVTSKSFSNPSSRSRPGCGLPADPIAGGAECTEGCPPPEVAVAIDLRAARLRKVERSQECSSFAVRRPGLANRRTEANLRRQHSEDGLLNFQGRVTMARPAKSDGVNKSQAIRDHLASHPDAKPMEVVSALKEKGIDVKPGLVGLIKYQTSGMTKKTRRKPGRKPGRKPRRKPARAKASRRAAAGKHGSKSDAVRAYLAAHRDASPNDVAAALRKKGIRISTSLASQIKYSKGTKAGRPRGRRGPGRPRMTNARASRNGAALDVGALLEAKRLAERMGGIKKAREALAVLARLA